MKRTIETRVPNALISGMDYEHGELPETLDSGIVATIHSCFAIGTIPDCAGTVHTLLTDEPHMINATDMHLAWSGTVHTPNKEISVCSVCIEQLMSISVGDTDPYFRRWANDLEEPDRLIITIESNL